MKFRVLYIDVPFEQEAGGDKNRSRFLWEELCKAFDTECLLIDKAQPAPPQNPTPSGRIRPVLRLVARPGSFYQSASVLAFSSAARLTFHQLLQEKGYDAVVCRFHSHWHLACLASAHPQRPAVVVDLDMLSSRLVGLTWQANPSWRNRWFLAERWKLERLERRLFRKPFLILFSNPNELAEVNQHYGLKEGPARLQVLPNVMPPPSPPFAGTAKRVILFFGSMNSAANIDGFKFLVDELLPRLRADLKRHDTAIHIVGKNPPAWFHERLKESQAKRVVLVGAVESMEQTLAESSFVLLPLRIASGTRTRLLEAAALRKAVVTTTLGAEGLDVGDDALVEDEPEKLAEAVRRLLADPALAKRCGERLHARCRLHYAPERVGATLTNNIVAWVEQKRENRTPATCL
jgi:glycosyltransferase involved in cell wall biosynthesis